MSMENSTPEHIRQQWRDYCMNECPYREDSECWTNCPRDDDEEDDGE